MFWIIVFQWSNLNISYSLSKQHCVSEFYWLRQYDTHKWMQTFCARTHTQTLGSLQVRGPKWNCLKLHLSTLLLNSSPQPHSESCTHLYNEPWFNFFRPGPGCLLTEEGGKEGWENRDSSIVWLPPGCTTGTWTQFNRTRSTAATKVP